VTKFYKKDSQLTKKLENGDYEIATDSNGMLKMNIADCFFPQQLHITLHIPLKVRNTGYKLF